MAAQGEFTTWNAENRQHLTTIWRDLVGEAIGNDEALLNDQEHQPVFHGNEISLSNAGLVFQTWIIKAFELSGAEIEPPFRVPGVDSTVQHEIDGLLIFDSKGFLIESKFQHIDFGPIARLHVLTEGRPVGTMGLLFAAKGFTSPAIEAIQLLRPIRVLLFDQDDIECILAADDWNFTQAVRLKWKAATMYGKPNYPIARLLTPGADI